VNAIGAIRTEPGGAAWRQTIFHPFALAARHARGNVLRAVVASPTRAGHLHPEMPYLVASATHDEASGRTAVFALNRHLAEAQELTVELRGLDPPCELVETQELFHVEMDAANTRDAPDTVKPQPHRESRMAEGQLRARLKPGSWNVFVLQHAERNKP
jgi:alpha-N-arabinofuranosidase